MSDPRLQIPPPPPLAAWRPACAACGRCGRCGCACAGGRSLRGACWCAPNWLRLDVRVRPDHATVLIGRPGVVPWRPYVAAAGLDNPPAPAAHGGPAGAPAALRGRVTHARRIDAAVAAAGAACGMVRRGIRRQDRMRLDVEIAPAARTFGWALYPARVTHSDRIMVPGAARTSRAAAVRAAADMALCAVVHLAGGAAGRFVPHDWGTGCAVCGYCARALRRAPPPAPCAECGQPAAVRIHDEALCRDCDLRRR